ncbi:MULTISPECIES: hypothetical protein [unclassified Sphingomonas]|nr:MULTISPECIES: hypothetical protein [unclassified Sphingomonas]
MSRLPYSRTGRKERSDGPTGRRTLSHAALALLLISVLLGSLGWGLSGLG